VVAAEAKAVSPAELKPRLSADTAKKKSGKDGASTGAKPEETAETKLTKKPLDTPKTTARESDPSGPVRQLPEKQEQELLQVKQQLRKPDERSVPGLSSPLLQLAQPAQQQAMGHNVPSSHVQSTETFSPTITGEDGVPMVLVPAGEFMMGAGSVSSKYREDELPVHPVYLDGYYIDRYEVTTTRYATFLRATKRMAPNYWSDTVVQRHGRKPVIGVDWDDATAYCAWVGKRLPTEVEWEKAARGTDQRVYPWGNEVPSEQRANFSHCCSFKDYGVLTDVGSFEQGKSPFGVYDMVGNVEEWVLDWYDPRYYSKYYPARNPTGPSSGYYRMTRGGSWIDEPVNIRSACRRPAAPTYRNDDLGFRCAQDIPK
jgi:formylglycine-generating enzyme required for sulfatase activity